MPEYYWWTHRSLAIEDLHVGIALCECSGDGSPSPARVASDCNGVGHVCDGDETLKRWTQVAIHYAALCSLDIAADYTSAQRFSST